MKINWLVLGVIAGLASFLIYLFSQLNNKLEIESIREAKVEAEIDKVRFVTTYFKPKAINSPYSSEIEYKIITDTVTKRQYLSIGNYSVVLMPEEK